MRKRIGDFGRKAWDIARKAALRLSPRALWARFSFERWLTPRAALYWALSLLVLCAIFIFGAQSGEASGALSRKIVEFLRRVLPFLGNDVETIHFVVRKLAHFSIFFLLSVFLLAASKHTFRNYRKASLWVLVTILALAAANEIEQNFAEGRGPAVTDVLIDFSGALLGAIALKVLWTIAEKAKRKKRSLNGDQPIFDAKTKWICASEFANLAPVNVFHRESENLPCDERNQTLRNFHMYARRAFRVGASAESAEILISADDYYKLYINGEYVAQGPAPGYPDHYYVNRIDVLPYLKSGDNVIALDVYYQGLVNRVWVSGDLRQGFICELRVDDRVVARSDEHFHYVRSEAYETKDTFGYDTQFAEHFDSREEPAGWKALGYDDFMWTACSVKNHSDYHFCLQPTPTLKTGVMAPVSVKHEGNRYLCDFGREISGVMLLRAEGDAGKKLTIHMGEELNGDEVRWQTRCNCNYEDTWTLGGKVCEWEMYDYRGFRYAEIVEEKGAKLLSVGARVQGYPLNEDACTLDSDDEALNEVFELCKNTIRAGVQEQYVDCPTREKGQYSGDLAVTSLSHLYLSGDIRLLRKSLDDWMRSQTIADGLMAVFPSALMQEIADYSLLFPMVALRYYDHSGDKEYLKTTYEAGKKMLGAFEKYARADGLLENVTESWNLVDWPENLRDGYDFPLKKPVGEGCHNVVNAFYLGAVRDMERIARELGMEEESRFKALCDAFHAAFYREETGLYADAEGTNHSAAHSNILPLFFKIAPRGKENAIADWLVSRGMQCGVYMAFFYLKALAGAGRYEDVYRLIVDDGERSWRNMLKEGATTLFEAWGKDQKWNTSLCHPWASAPVAVLVEDILGITPETARGGVWKSHLPESVERMRMTVPVLDQKMVFIRENGTSILTMEKRESL